MAITALDQLEAYLHDGCKLSEARAEFALACMEFVTKLLPSAYLLPTKMQEDLFEIQDAKETAEGK